MAAPTPLPMLMLAAKGGGLVKAAGPALAEWNRLEPAAKARVSDEASALMKDLNQVRRALGTQLFGAEDENEMSWEEAKLQALDPALDFITARRLVAIVLAETELSEAELRHQMGAVSDRDSVFNSALEIAEDDGYGQSAGCTCCKSFRCLAKRPLARSQ